MYKFYNKKADLYKIILNYRNIVELLNKKVDGIEENAGALVLKGEQLKRTIHKFERKRLLALNELEISQLYEELFQTEKELVQFRNDVLSVWLKQNVKGDERYNLCMTR